jgi:hypothetical protein
MNGISDWSPLSGDPGCTESLDEWAESMMTQLARLDDRILFRTLHDMTEDEFDAIREFVAKQGQEA